jgi:hypothetical protein
MKKRFFLSAFIACMFLAGGTAAAQGVLPGYDGIWNRDTKISVLDILAFYPDRIPYLRNEIYARYGRPFVTPEYQAYFNRRHWYRIRSNYTDDWLSEADKYNAELLRAIEMAPSAAEVLDTIVDKVEYRSSEYILSFNRYVAIEEEVNGYFANYGRNYDEDSNWPYVIVGDWVILYRRESSGSSRVYYAKACRLELSQREGTITACAEGYVMDTILDPLISAQGRRDTGR